MKVGFQQSLTIGDGLKRRGHMPPPPPEYGPRREYAPGTSEQASSPSVFINNGNINIGQSGGVNSSNPFALNPTTATAGESGDKSEDLLEMLLSLLGLTNGSQNNLLDNKLLALGPSLNFLS